MLGMDLVSFLILLVVSIAVSAGLHYGCKIYVRPGLESFLSKIIVGWIGAWLGTPVLGHWIDPISYGSIYIIPAILGSLALLVLAIDLMKMLTGRSAST